jgi:hypothetical protein
MSDGKGSKKGKIGNAAPSVVIFRGGGDKKGNN